MFLLSMLLEKGYGWQKDQHWKSQILEIVLIYHARFANFDCSRNEVKEKAYSNDWAGHYKINCTCLKRMSKLSTRLMVDEISHVLADVGMELSTNNFGRSSSVHVRQRPDIFDEVVDLIPTKRKCGTNFFFFRWFRHHGIWPLPLDGSRIGSFKRHRTGFQAVYAQRIKNTWIGSLFQFLLLS